MIARLNQTLTRLADATSITGKIMGIVLALTLVLGLGLTLYVRTSTRILLAEQLDSRGLTIAEGVATRALEPVLMGNEFALHGLLEETSRLHPDVRYVMVISQRAEILGDTFRRQIPVGLVELNTVGPDGEQSIVAVSTDEGRVRDIALPLFGGRGGVVRVGMSERLLEAELNQQTANLLLATLGVSVLGVWVSYRLSRVLVRPITSLVSATTRLTDGDLSVQAPVFAQDEIGRLAAAFNAMTRHMEAQYTEIRWFNEQILRDNAELVALSSITGRLSRLHHIETLPALAGRLMADRLDLTAARVLLWDPDTEEFDPLPEPGVRSLATQALAEQSVAVEGGAAAVPLIAGERPVGVLFICCSPERLQAGRDHTFLQSIGNHLTVALENARLVSELTEKQQVLTHLFDRAVSAQEEERRRISRELHDETSQSLTSLMLGLRSVEESASPAELKQSLAQLRERLLRTLDSVHEMARRLRPLALDDLGLSAALSRHVQELVEQTGMDIDIDLAGLGEERLAPDVETAVYRIVQEAVANALRHAQASQISVVVERQRSLVIAIVEDNGTGFDTAPALKRANRLGLSGMRERASLVGGTLTVESALGTGTTICLRVPEARA